MRLDYIKYRIFNLSERSCFIAHSTFGTYLTGKEVIEDCNILVFNDLEIMKAYKKIYNDKEFIFIKTNSLIRIISILLKSRVVYTSHECCWFILDLALLLTQKKHTHIITFTMEGYTKVKGRQYYKINKYSKIRNLNQNIMTQCIRIFFDVFWYKQGTKTHQMVRNISIKKRFIRQRLILQNSYILPDKKIIFSKSTMVVISLLSLNIYEQVKHYNNILRELDELGHTIYLKNHIRQKLQFDINKLELKNLRKNVIVLPSGEAAEHLIEQFSISQVISVASSTLAYPRIKGISTLELLECDENYKTFRKVNLESQAAKNNISISYIYNWKDIANHVKA